MNDRNRSSRCPQCGSPELMRLDLTVKDAPMAFTTCPTCEARWWERDGAVLPLTSVLEAVGAR